MKKILLILFVLISFISSAQKLQFDNTYGREFQRVQVDTLLGLPKDTFLVPATLQNIPFIANKAGSIYNWNISTHVWDLFSSGGGGTDNANVGAFYRWLKPATQEIKTVANGYGLLIDSTTNTDALTAILDSATVFPHIRASITPNLLFDSLGAAGISPITTWNNTLYGRRISISGGSIDTTASGGLLITVAGGGITSLNGLTGATQTFATATTGTDFTISSSGTAHTFAIPNAGAGISRGLVTNGTQTLVGNKIFSGVTEVTGGLTTTTTGFNGNLFVMGGTTATRTTTAGYLVEGAAGIGFRAGFRGSTSYTISTAGDAYANVILGNTTVQEFGSGNHPLIAGLVIRAPTITGAVATVSNTATLFIDAAPSATVSGKNYAAWFKSGEVGLGNGNLSLETAGNKLNIATGSNASIGVSGAMTAGTITISTTAVTASSIIILTHATLGGTQGILSVGTITAGTSFVINSSNAADTGTVNWWIVN